MKSYSQNKEDLWVLKRFKGFVGTLLEIGANDGLTLSNSRLLIEQGFVGHLIEPSSVFSDLEKLYANNLNIHLYNYGIAGNTDVVTLYESGAHVPGGKDKALVSSIDRAETEKWRKSGVEFKEIDIKLVDFNTFWFGAGYPQFDFISIDAESLDWEILQQIDLTAVGCKMLCIEWNTDDKLRQCFEKYCAGHGMRIDHINRENIIFIR